MKKLRKIFAMVLVWELIFSNLLVLFTAPNQVLAATLTGSRTVLYDPRPSQSSSYVFNFSNISTGSTVACISISLATTASGTTIAATGIATTNATLDTGSSSSFFASWTGFTMNTGTTGTFRITKATGVTPQAGTGAIKIDTITNGSTANTTYYVQFYTYGDQSCTQAVDSGVGAFVYTNGQAVSMTVDPTFTYTILPVNSSQSVNSSTTTVTTTATTIPFGTVTAATNAIAAHDIGVTTNAGSGFTVYTRYTAQLTNGSHNINDHSGSNASPSVFSAAGTEAFGYTTEDTSLGVGTTNRFSSNKWAAFTTANGTNEVVYNAAATASLLTRIGYQVGIGATTPAGTYTTTVILTAVPSY